MIKRMLFAAILLCFCSDAFCTDFLGFGGKIGVGNGWGYDQGNYQSGMQPSIVAGAFVDFWLWRFLSLSIEADYHPSQFEYPGPEIDRYDFATLFPHVNFVIPFVRWKPLFTIGPRFDELVNIATQDPSGNWTNNDLSVRPSDMVLVVSGLSLGLGLVSPRFHRFDFTLEVFYNAQLAQAGVPPPPQGSSLGGGDLFVPQCQTIDVVASFAFHPFRNRR